MKGNQAAGKAYEGKVARFLARELKFLHRSSHRVYKSQWLEYEDASGHHFAQPDLFIHTGDRIAVFESKLSRVGAFEQIGLLYWPLLWHIFSVPLSGVEVFQNPGPDYDPHPEGPDNLREALSLSDWTLAEWHLLL